MIVGCQLVLEILSQADLTFVWNRVIAIKANNQIGIFSDSLTGKPQSAFYEPGRYMLTHIFVLCCVMVSNCLYILMLNTCPLSRELWQHRSTLQILTQYGQLHK